MGKEERKLIEEYWRKDAERKRIEAKIVKYDRNHMYEHSVLIQNELEKLGAIDLMLICEDIEAPKLTFKLNGNVYTTDCLYDFSYENVMNNINEKLKQ